MKLETSESGPSVPVEPRASSAPAVRAFFQPIIDLMTGLPIGYEALARGVGSEPQSPIELFARARERGLVWELERACRMAAIADFSLQAPHGSSLLFLNVSPNVIEDPRFVEGFTLATLREFGIDPGRVVIEVTEDEHIADPTKFQRVVAHYTAQGFRFATDDFGSGHSSLLSLIACAPAFIKLDMEIVRDIDRSNYKRHIVRSLTGFAASVDARLIAEGVETWEELEMLLRLGVRYAQGFVLARPEREPQAGMTDATLARLQQTLRSAHIGLGDPEENIDALMAMPMVVPAQSMTVEELETTLRRLPSLDHMVVVRQGKPVGLITREDLSTKHGRAALQHVHGR